MDDLLVADVQWEDVRGWFDPQWNGSAPDGVIRATTVDDWNLIARLAAGRGWRIEYREDRRIPMPASLDLAFRHDRECQPMIFLWPKPDTVIDFRLLSPERMDFDFCLHDVQDQAGLDWLCGFVRIVGRELAKDVEIMPESSEEPFLLYSAATDSCRVARAW